MSLMERVGSTRVFFGEVRAEMDKVTWPNRDEVRGTTVIVLLTVFFFGFYLYVLDVVMSYVSAFVTSLIGR